MFIFLQIIFLFFVVFLSYFFKVVKMKYCLSGLIREWFLMDGNHVSHVEFLDNVNDSSPNDALADKLTLFNIVWFSRTAGQNCNSPTKRKINALAPMFGGNGIGN